MRTSHIPAKICLIATLGAGLVIAPATIATAAPIAPAAQRAATTAEVPFEVTSPATFTYGKRLTVAGTAAPGMLVVLADAQGEPIGQTDVRVTDDGTWTTTTPTVIREQAVTYRVHLIDANFQLVGSKTITFENDDPDATYPAVTVTTPSTYVVGQKVHLTGTAAPDALVSITGLSGPHIFSVRADDQGNWSMPAPIALLERSYHLTIEQRHVADGVTEEITFDMTGEIADITYQDRTFKHGERFGLVGWATPGAGIEVVRVSDGTLLGTAVADDDGSWVIRNSTVDVTGPRLDVEIRQDAGELGKNSRRVSFEVGAPAYIAPYRIQGSMDTVERILRLEGFGMPGAKVEILSTHGDVLGSATVSLHGAIDVRTDAKLWAGTRAVLLKQTHELGTTTVQFDIPGED